MNHGVSIAGLAYGLRPVGLADAALIVKLRTGNPARTRFLHPTSSDIGEQERWIERYLLRPDDYYFVIERRADHRPEGVVAIYDVDAEARRAEWGRWILNEGSMASIETPLLVYRAAFGPLSLNELYSDTNAENKPVVSFHDSVGIHRVGRIEGRFFFNEQHHAAIRHACTVAQWPTLEKRLIDLATPVARRMALRA